MKKQTVFVLIGILLIIFLTVYPLIHVQNSEFGGADGEAEVIINDISPNYEPWFDNFWAPPGSETESFLFALQAAIGSGIFCYLIGYFVGMRKNPLKQKGKSSDKND